MTGEERQWHLDKKVIVTLIFGMISLFLAGVGDTAYIVSSFTEWKTGTDDRLTVLEKDDKVQETHEARITALEKSDTGMQSHEGRITILEQQFSFIRSDLAEIKELLKRRIPEPTSP